MLPCRVIKHDCWSSSDIFTKLFQLVWSLTAISGSEFEPHCLHEGLRPSLRQWALRSSASINMQSRYIATTHCDDTRWAGTVIPVDLQLEAAGLSHAKQLHTYIPAWCQWLAYLRRSNFIQRKCPPPLTARHNEATLLPCVRGWWNTKREEELCTGFSVWQGSGKCCYTLNVLS